MLRALAVSLALVLGGGPGLPAAAQTGGPTDGGTASKPASQAASKAPAAGKLSTPAAGGTAAKPAAKAAAKKPASKTPREPGLDEVDPNQLVSDQVVDIAAWVIATGDNRGLPFAIIDKRAAQILVFADDGKLRGLAPALIGSAVGDDSAPGVGDRELKDIPAADRTTPAGRFLAAFGPAAGGKTVLWVDYATSISIHPLDSTAASKKEKRKERLASATPKDNRITHGCINVSPQFFTKIVRPAFEDAGVFYILPDTVSLRRAFPAFDQPSHVAIRDE